MGADDGLHASDGGEFLVGDTAQAENPRLTTPPDFLAFTQMFFHCRGGMGGFAHWPDAGGVADQAAWVADAFNVLLKVENETETAKRQRGQT